MEIRIGIIGDYDGSKESHRATDAALVHASSFLSLGIDPVWLPTVSFDAPDFAQSRASFDAFLVAPGSPYQSMNGASPGHPVCPRVRATPAGCLLRLPAHRSGVRT
jgi:CTP synthase (UTP-ammonia lyase)